MRPMRHVGNSPAICCRVAASGRGRLVSTISVSSICIVWAQGGVRVLGLVVAAVMGAVIRWDSAAHRMLL